MQTFLPYMSFSKSARCLDYKRLGKQRVETKQLLLALEGRSRGWHNHPACLMWQGCNDLLAEYGATMCREWIARGYNDSLLSFFEQYPKQYPLAVPNWLGDRDFHISHRSNLLRKSPIHYRQFWPDLVDNLPYVWPK